MSWITGTDGATPLEAVLGQRPELLTRYRAFYRALWQDGGLPRRLLELIRLRVAAIHDCEAEWVLRDPGAGLSEAELGAIRRGDTTMFAAAEQAALAVAEQMPYVHHQISDADVAALADAYGASGAVALLTALAFFDVTCRLKLVLEVEPLACELDDPPLKQGALV